MARLEEMTPEQRQELFKMGEAAANACESGEGFIPIEEMMERPDFDPMPVIATLVAQKRMIDAEFDARIADLVILMHDHGASWERIGRELGITGEATRLRYGKLARDRRQ